MLGVGCLPYRGTVPAFNHLVGGRISLMFGDVPPALALIERRPGGSGINSIASAAPKAFSRSPCFAPPEARVVARTLGGEHA